MATNENSIRQIVRRGLEAGKTTAQIALDIQAVHPDKMGAIKASKHIGWYRSKMKAVWNIVTPVKASSATETMTETTESVDLGSTSIETAPDVVTVEPVEAPISKREQKRRDRAARLAAESNAVAA